jgi:hypothetical protein
LVVEVVVSVVDSVVDPVVDSVVDSIVDSVVVVEVSPLQATVIPTAKTKNKPMIILLNKFIRKTPFFIRLR